MANSAIKISWIGGSMAVASGLIATAIQWKYPQQTHLADGLLILAGLIVFASVIAVIARHLALKEYEREHTSQNVPAQITQTANPHNEFNPRLDYNPQNVFTPTIDVHVPVSQSQSVRATPAPTRDPVFECRRTRFRRYCLNTQTGALIREQYDGDPSQVYDYLKFVNTALAKFLYRADPGVDPHLSVSAHVYIYGKPETDDQLTPAELEQRSANTTKHVDIYQAIWDDDEPSSSVGFYAGSTHELIIGLVPAGDKPKGVIGYEYGTKRNPFAAEYRMLPHRVFSPELHNVVGQEFFVRVELIPKLGSEIRCKLPIFWFRLSLAAEQPALTFVGTV